MWATAAVAKLRNLDKFDGKYATRTQAITSFVSWHGLIAYKQEALSNELVLRSQKG